MASDPVVRLLGTSCIVPSTPTLRKHLFLSSLDLFWQDVHYNQRVLFYKPSSQTLSAHAIDTLKSSLSLVLVHFYPWAGRLVKEEDGRIAIDCNDLGVEFVEASIDMSLAELEKDDYHVKDFFDKLCQHVDHKNGSLFTSPLLSVQVTSFSDGGLALALAQSHVVADGQSLWHFMVSWGECARGETISMEPLHERERMAVPNPSEEKAIIKFTNDETDDETEDDQHAKEKEQTSVSQNGDTQVQIAQNPLIQGTFLITETAIQTLKNQTLLDAEHLPPHKHPHRPFSSYEVMCAHFCKRVTIARCLPASTPVRFAILANLRSRITPPLPPAYFGNVITFGIAMSTAGKIAHESLAATASRIRGAIACCNETNLYNLMHWLELHDNRIMNTLKVVGVGMMVASSPRFPVYKVDFGWGKPAAVRAVKVNGDGELVVFGGKPGYGVGDVEICMPLKSTAMHKLLHDDKFLASSHFSTSIMDPNP